MKIIIQDLTDDFLDLEDYQAERALQFAALDAMDRAKRCGTGFVVWENDRVRVLKPDETGEYRQRSLANLERLNRKITELQKLSPKTLALNDQPPQK
jgi:hypothetical protein